MPLKRESGRQLLATAGKATVRQAAQTLGGLRNLRCYQQPQPLGVDTRPCLGRRGPCGTAQTPATA
jgi:hypothetical protein